MAADPQPGGPVLCSACLLGLACRYDGRDKRSEAVLRFLEGREVVPICPEAAAGLGIPRPAVHIAGAGAEQRWRDLSGRDRTREFQQGGLIAAQAAHRFGSALALLKEGSPSCGVRRVYGAEGPRPGMGAAARALLEAGVSIVSDEELGLK